MIREIIERRRPWRAASVAIIRDGHVLLLKRADSMSWMPGTWNFPGGSIDMGEKPSRAARREAFEEAGLRVGGVSRAGKFSVDGGELWVYVTSDFRGEPKINWESSEMVWVPLQDALGYELVPVIGDVIRGLVGENTNET